MSSTLKNEEQELGNLTIDQLKDAIVQTCVRQAQAEEDLSAYKDTYTEVIKEEKAKRAMYLVALIAKKESARLVQKQAE